MSAVRSGKVGQMRVFKIVVERGIRTFGPLTLSREEFRREDAKVVFLTCDTELIACM